MLPPPKDPSRVASAARAVATLAEVFGPRMIAGQGFMAFSRNASFRGDPGFAEAAARLPDEDARFRVWALHVLDWAFESSAKVEGSAVFFGTMTADVEFLARAHAGAFEGRDIVRLGENDAAAPRRIAFLHLAAKDAAIELAALERLSSGLQSGAVVVVEDFGASALIERHVALLQFFRARGMAPLEIGTAQGIVLWR